MSIKHVIDPCSCANHDQVRVTHVSLLWDIDFSSQIISGHATFELSCLKPDIDHLMLDMRDLLIHRVTTFSDDIALDFSVTNSHFSAYGQCLKIDLTSLTEKDKCKINIHYSTSPNCTALQWLTAEQTVGRRYPYMFSQCEAIHARSLLPCQDTCCVKFTYDAQIVVDDQLIALMSALIDGDPDCNSVQYPTRKVFKFRQPVPIPSYLIAIVVGKLSFKRIGPRSLVWSEPEIVDAAALEFNETELMLQKAEDLMGPYLWTEYNLLVLPPSFPYGGMENPCLTFVTPTILTGDKSLTDVIAHEICHSWTGNLFTNATFQHFWLNEGHTVFMERKVKMKIHNLSETYRGLQSLIEFKHMERAIERLGHSHPFTKLVIDEKDFDPDESFSVIPYEKGHAFLYYLEQKVGGPDIFEPFLRSVIEKFKFSTLTSDDYRHYFNEYFTKLNLDISLDDIDWNSWLSTPGMPYVLPNYDDSMAKDCVHLLNQWLKASSDEYNQFTSDDLAKMIPLQVIYFLSLLLDEQEISLNMLMAMDNCYKFSQSKNCEITVLWINICIKAEMESIIPVAINFATQFSRMKYCRPIFCALYKWEKSRELAIDAFLSNRKFLHNITAAALEKDLHLK